MSLRIALDQPTSVQFLPGQPVTGKVLLSLTKDEELRQVVIRFRGKISTAIPHGKETKFYKQIIFNFEKTLFSGGKFKMRATNYEWPFAFRFPERFECRSANQLSTEFDANSQFNTEADQRLPPSCSTGYDQRNGGSVRYKLRAKVDRPMAVDYKTKTHLYFTQPRLEASPDPQFKAIEKRQGERLEELRYRFGENYTPRALTTKESFKETFHKDSETQHILFAIELSAPTNVIVGKGSHILIRINVKPTEMVIPEFKLTALDVRLCDRSNIRVPGVWGDSNNSVSEEIKLYNRERLQLQLETNEWTKINGAFPDGGSKWNSISPSFSTTAINRHYSLEITAKIEGLEKEFKITRNWNKVTVLASKMEDGVAEAAEMIRTGNFLSAPTDGAPEDGELPSYEGETSDTVIDPATTAEMPVYSEQQEPPTYKETQKN